MLSISVSISIAISEQRTRYFIQFTIGLSRLKSSGKSLESRSLMHALSRCKRRLQKPVHCRSQFWRGGLSPNWSRDRRGGWRARTAPRRDVIGPCAVRTPTDQYLEGRGQTEPASRLVVEWMRQAWTTSRRPTHRHQQSQPRRLRQPPTYPSEKVTSVTVNLKHILPLASCKFDIHQNRFRSFLAGVLLTKSEKVKKIETSVSALFDQTVNPETGFLLKLKLHFIDLLWIRCGLAVQVEHQVHNESKANRSNGVLVLVNRHLQGYHMLS